jgi:ATP-dependent Clp protease ATP-binding subunit ClpB
VFNTLLQLLDDGRLTDSQGRTVDFRNTVIIMTSNIGSMHLLEGVTDQGEIRDDARDRVMGDLRGHFRPEFLNRIDEIVLFKPLTLREIERIVGLQIDLLRERLTAHRLTVVATEAALELIAREGYDPVYGARPLRRFIQREVETRIARALIGGEATDGGTVTIDADGNELVLRFSAPAIAAGGNGDRPAAEPVGAAGGS